MKFLWSYAVLNHQKVNITPLVTKTVITSQWQKKTVALQTSSARNSPLNKDIRVNSLFTLPKKKAKSFRASSSKKVWHALTFAALQKKSGAWSAVNRVTGSLHPLPTPPAASVSGTLIPYPHYTAIFLNLINRGLVTSRDAWRWPWCNKWAKLWTITYTHSGEKLRGEFKAIFLSFFLTYFLEVQGRKSLHGRTKKRLCVWLFARRLLTPPTVIITPGVVQSLRVHLWSLGIILD